jgi:hypothetical protein
VRRFTDARDDFARSALDCGRTATAFKDQDSGGMSIRLAEKRRGNLVCPPRFYRDLESGRAATAAQSASRESGWHFTRRRHASAQTERPPDVRVYLALHGELAMQTEQTPVALDAFERARTQQGSAFRNDLVPVRDAAKLPGFEGRQPNTGP